MLKSVFCIKSQVHMVTIDTNQEQTPFQYSIYSTSLYLHLIKFKSGLLDLQRPVSQLTVIPLYIGQLAASQPQDLDPTRRDSHGR